MEQKPASQRSDKPARPSLARYILIGIVVLAVAAVAIAWADATGVTAPILKALNNSRY